jgi:carboxypeptidase C (cathepsin A)
MVILLAVILPASWGPAGDAWGADPSAGAAGAATNAASEPPLSVTHHALTLPGETLRYTATAGLLRLPDEAGTPKAELFFVAYAQEPVPAPATRPLTFAFNGGPGASAIWLHLGALGPLQVSVPSVGGAVPPPYTVGENADSWLSFTDLVFIDPVGTGYSRAVAGEDPKQFYGVEADIRSIGAFIRQYLTRFQRWGAPIFLAGESYGTLRAVGLAAHLFQADGISVNGLILLSQALNFQALTFTLENDLPYVVFLPTYAATAWYHAQGPPASPREFRQQLAEVEQWALTEYTVALAQGDRLDEAARERLVARLRRYTGLPATTITTQHGRITREQFRQELLRAQGRVVGLYDSRLTRAPARALFAEPGLAENIGPYVATWQAYVRQQLQYAQDRPYAFLSDDVNRAWQWGSAEHGYVNVTPILREVVQQHPSLQVFIASGYYDLTTPYFAAQYVVDHLGLEPEVRHRITLAAYAAGHQLYTDPVVLHQLTQDVAHFLTKALAEHGR